MNSSAKVAALLNKWTKAELIELVSTMIRHEPQLRGLLELRPPGRGNAAIDPIRRQVATCLQPGTHDHWRPHANTDGVYSILEVGETYLEAGEAAKALAVYGGVAIELAEADHWIWNDDGEMLEVASDCVDGIAACLGKELTAAERLSAFESLLALHRCEIEIGGIGIAAEAPDLMIEQASPEERRVLVEWVRDALPPQSDESYLNWGRECLGGLLLELEASDLDDESYLALCRETCRTLDLVERLLSLGREEEAVAAAKEEGDYSLLQLAELFGAHGRDQLAEDLVRERSKTSRDTRLLDWLKERCLARGDKAGALELVLEAFRSQPSMERYKEARKLASALSRWKAVVRPELMQLVSEDRYVNFRVRLHILEGELGPALAAVSRMHVGNGLQLEVARAAEEKRPKAALGLYRNAAEHLIALRGRKRYRAACGHLESVRDLHARLGEQEAWLSYVANLRAENRQLRALREELDRARL